MMKLFNKIMWLIALLPRIICPCKLCFYIKILVVRRLRSYWLHSFFENCPNSICEAQILGVPVVSTYVGGISTLLGDDGIMVPANAPWQMACAIIELAKDKLEIFSKNGWKKALKRLNPQSIKQDLLNCCKSIVSHTI